MPLSLFPKEDTYKGHFHFRDYNTNHCESIIKYWSSFFKVEPRQRDRKVMDEYKEPK